LNRFGRRLAATGATRVFMRIDGVAVGLPAVHR
jgi:hypothetical protein